MIKTQIINTRVEENNSSPSGESSSSGASSSSSEASSSSSGESSSSSGASSSSSAESSSSSDASSSGASSSIMIEPTVNFNLKNEYLEKCSNDLYSKECNTFMLKKELMERKDFEAHENEHDNLYPDLNDPKFIIKIAEKKEFNDNKYDGEIYDIKKHAEILNKADFELAPHQIFIKNFMSFQTPYNSLLLYHGLGTGKTCTAIGVSEEMRDYIKQMGITKKIIIVASPNVQDNFKLQLFDERKLKLVDGIWNIRSCTGNKLLKEINPMNMKGLTKERVISQIKTLIHTSYLFLGYDQFANYIERVQQVNDHKSERDLEKKRIRNLRNEFDYRLIIIDEIHNIRVSADSDHKRVADKLLQLVKSAENMRLLLLSATPMYNNYKEIVWLLNLININDRRPIVRVGDIFDANGDFLKNESGEEIGKELLIRKSTGYVSFVRGNNPYTFPYRIYPSIFSPKHSFKSKSDMKIDALKYPKYQMNGKEIKQDDAMKFLDLYLTKIGSYQSYAYKYVINQLRYKNITITTKQGVVKDMPNFTEMDSFGYTLLMLPLETLNMTYPLDGLEEASKNILKIRDYSLISSENTTSPPLEEIKRIKDMEKRSSETVNSSEVEYVEASSDEPEESKTMYKPVEKSEEESSSSDTGDSSSSAEDVKIGGESSSEEQSSSSLSSSSSKSSSSSGSNSSSSNREININTTEITGGNGLKRVMNFIDSKNPPEKGSFEYKPHILKNHGAIFSAEHIGKYSSKIKNICNEIMTSEGIILIYSSMLDGALVPVALALEELGFSRFGKNTKSLFKNRPSPLIDSRTMKPRSGEDFQPARYSMITGDPRFSPDNDFEVKALTSIENINGDRIKVVLISRAGSEGIDFKCIRQVHIMDPWYNINRIEQIIGRAVRNSSHKDLEFEKRNVEIFMYGTILEDEEEESADLYVYRVAESKAITMGKVTRVLKETAVDCIINHDQTNFTRENFLKIEENREIKQILPNGRELDKFHVGDLPYSAECDYMETCDYKCYPTAEKININMNSYNENFIIVNSDKIIQKIKMLMREKFFYKKKDLIRRINVPKPYPIVQIYTALTQMIEERELITDRYGRSGYLINIGEYYLFQPSELKNEHISIFEREVPIDFKHSKIIFDVKPPVEEEHRIKQKIHHINLENILDENKLMGEMKRNYQTTVDVLKSEYEKLGRGEDNWYKHCGITFKKMISENILDEPTALQLLVEHIVDMLVFHDKVELLNIIYSINSEVMDDFETMIKKYLDTTIIETKRLTAVILYSSSRKHVFIYKNKKWVEGEPEDVYEIENKYESIKGANPMNFNNLLGFIDYENKNKYLVFKYKYTGLKRNVGARCDDAGKDKKIKVLNDLFGFEKYNKENTRGIVQGELCSLQEMLFRKYNKDKKDGKVWFLPLEYAKMYKL